MHALRTGARARRPPCAGTRLLARSARSVARACSGFRSRERSRHESHGEVLLSPTSRPPILDSRRSPRPRAVGYPKPQESLLVSKGKHKGLQTYLFKYLDLGIARNKFAVDRQKIVGPFLGTLFVSKTGDVEWRPTVGAPFNAPDFAFGKRTRKWSRFLFFVFFSF